MKTNWSLAILNFGQNLIFRYLHLLENYKILTEHPLLARLYREPGSRIGMNDEDQDSGSGVSTRTQRIQYQCSILWMHDRFGFTNPGLAVLDTT